MGIVAQTTETPREFPDLDRAETQNWPSLEFPPTVERVLGHIQVVVKQSVLNDIHEHGQSRTDVEICGVLVGDAFRDEQGGFVYVQASIRGRHSDSRAAQVTFTAETWNEIQNELDRIYPELRILGWYHTHPGFGIFLSDMDLFIHDNFFSAPEQLALVYDPLSGDEGMFVWRRGSAVREAFFLERDVPTSVEKTKGSPGVSASTDVQAEHLAKLEKRVTRIESWQKWICLGVGVSLAFSVAIPFAAHYGMNAGYFARFGLPPGISKEAPESRQSLDGRTARDALAEESASPHKGNSRDTKHIPQKRFPNWQLEEGIQLEPVPAKRPPTVPPQDAIPNDKNVDSQDPCGNSQTEEGGRRHNE